MFQNWRNLQEVDMTGLDVQYLKTMKYMFYGCSVLTKVSIGSKWKTTQVNYGADMFTGCTNLMGSQGTIYDSNKVDVTYAREDGGESSPGYFHRVYSYVAEVGSTQYEDLQAAITAAQAGDTVKLLKDVVLTSNLAEIQNTNLTIDLNGFGIRATYQSANALMRIQGIGYGDQRANVTLKDSNPTNESGENRPTGVKGGYITGCPINAIYVGGKAVFTMKGGTITGNGGGDIYPGGGIYVNQGGTFTMNGGAITNNRTSENGEKARAGGVYNNGTFTMTGGTIAGNTAGTDGGGVYNDGTFTMTGGTIAGNTAKGLGGGIFAQYSIKLSGGPVIKDNTAGETNSNVYLSAYNNQSTNQRKITVTGNLTNTDPIGVTMAYPGVFTSGLKNKGNASNFASDDNSYAVTLNNSGEALLVTHVHSFTYALATVTTANDSIVATCSNTSSCDLTDGKVTLTLTPTTTTAPESAPSGTIVIVNPANYQATLAGLAAFNEATALGIQQSDVKYYNTQNGAKTGEALAQTPYAAGTYCAEITAGGQTASIIYTISAPTYPGMPTSCAAEVTDTTVRIKTPAQSGETYEYWLGEGEWTTNPLFENLAPHTQYTISARIKEHPDDTVVSATATTYYTTTIDGIAKVGNKLTANVTDLTPESDYDFRWFVGETDTPSYGKTYTVQAADVGKQAKLVVTPKNSGTHVGEALSGPITAKTALTATDFTYTAPEGTVEGLVAYDGNPKAATVTCEGAGAITVEYWYGAGEAYVTDPPTEPGTYTVKVSMPETDNYSAVYHFTAQGWQFTITVPVTFDGGQLRRRVFIGTREVVDFCTDMRLKFTCVLPEGANIVEEECYFLWSTGDEASNRRGITTYDQEGNCCKFSLAIRNIPKASYGTSIKAELHITYMLNDVKHSVSAEGARTVNLICESLRNGTDTWADYAKYLLGEADTYEIPEG